MNVGWPQGFINVESYLDWISQRMEIDFENEKEFESFLSRTDDKFLNTVLIIKIVIDVH